MKIVVSETDIISGVRKNPYLCPVANALSRVDGIHRIYVGIARARYREMETERIFIGDIPLHIQEKLRNYDNGGKMEPFDFEMEFGVME